MFEDFNEVICLGMGGSYSEIAKGADNVLIFDLGDDYTGSCSIIIVTLFLQRLCFLSRAGSV